MGSLKWEFGGASRAKNLKIDFAGSYPIFGSTVWKKLNGQHTSPAFGKSTPSAEVIKGTLCKLQDNLPYQ